MNEEMECMCLECGISLYLNLDGILLESLEGSDLKLLKDTFCVECGGPLVLTGKAGDQPRYRVG